MEEPPAGGAACKMHNLIGETSGDMQSWLWDTFGWFRDDGLFVVTAGGGRGEESFSINARERRSGPFALQTGKLCHAFRPVNNPEIPDPIPQGGEPRVVQPVEPKAGASAEFQPRYVEVPVFRPRDSGRRNLAWGGLILILGLALFVVAIVLVGQKAVLCLLACLLTLSAVFVLARLRVFRQRNGGFLAIAVVVLVGAVISLADRGYEELVGLSSRIAGTTGVGGSGTEIPLLTSSVVLPAPDPSQPQVKVLKDSKVVIGDKPFMIRAGDLFPLVEAKLGEVTFAVRDLQVSLPVSVVEILGGKFFKENRETREAAMAAALAAAGTAEKVVIDAAGKTGKGVKPSESVVPAEPPISAEMEAVTVGAKNEATRRYPALGVKDSVENTLFVAAYRKYKDEGKAAFFSNPEWPLELAEILATRHHWIRGDRPAVLETPLEVIPDQDLPPPTPPKSTPQASPDAGPAPLPSLQPSDDPPQVPAPRRR